MKSEKCYNDVSEENQYQHKCPKCGEYFLGGKMHYTCKECSDARAELFKDLTEEESNIIHGKCVEMSKKIINFIKTNDKAMNGEFDDEEPVVGINALDTPIISGLSDMFYKGYVKGKHNE